MEKRKKYYHHTLNKLTFRKKKYLFLKILKTNVMRVFSCETAI